MNENFGEKIDPTVILKCLTEVWKAGQVRAIYMVTASFLFIIIILALVFVLCYATTWPDGVLTSSGYYNFDDPNTLSNASEIADLPEGYVIIRTLPIWGTVLIVVLIVILYIGLQKWAKFCEHIIRTEREDRKRECMNLLHCKPH